MAVVNIAESDLEHILKLIDDANSENEEIETEIKSVVHDSQSNTSLFSCDTCHKQYKIESGLTRQVINKHNLKVSVSDHNEQETNGKTYLIPNLELRKLILKNGA